MEADAEGKRLALLEKEKQLGCMHVQAGDPVFYKNMCRACYDKYLDDYGGAHAVRGCMHLAYGSHAIHS